MTVKVGDKVRSLINHYDVTKGNYYTVTELEGSSVLVIDDAGDSYWLLGHEYEPTSETTIATQIRDHMEEHMGKGEYVRAVKWAQLAEQVEALENE